MSEEMICLRCKHWGYFNGKPMDSVGNSMCLLRKQKTHGCNHCKAWEQVKKAGEHHE